MLESVPDRPLRVLLFSPDPDLDPPSGDTTYTQTLLEHPPPGVVYTPYSAAVTQGAVRVRGRRRPTDWHGVADLAVLALRTAELLTSNRLTYREPLWWVTIAPGAFDLVHAHLFALRQVGLRTPVVSSAGYPLSELYRRREGWSSRRVRVADRWRTAYGRSVGAHIPGYTAPASDLMTVYTEHYQNWLKARGERAAVRVLGQGLPDMTPCRRPSAIGFIGRDFVCKGGPLALEAFRLLRAADPGLRMLLLTRSGADLTGLPLDGVDIVLGADRAEVLTEHLPRMSVLLAPTASDCGAPYGILEALRAGVPVVLPPGPWLDSRLVGLGVARVGRAAPEFAAAAARALADPAAGEAARALFLQHFSLRAFHQELVSAYRAALPVRRAP